METRFRPLVGVIPIAQEVLREWAEITDFFGGDQVIADCMNSLTAHFLARLRRNSFELILTASAFTGLGRTEIRPREQGFQTEGEIVNPTSPPFVASMQRDFQIALQAQDGVKLRETLAVSPSSMMARLPSFSPCRELVHFPLKN
jgi:hypothetical protein